MQTFPKRGVLTCVLLLSLSGAAVALPVAHLELWSQKGDYIGQGRHFDISYTPDNSDWFSASSEPDALGRPDYLTFILGTVTGDDDNTFALLQFSTAKLRVPMQPGLYLGAQRAPFASWGHPGLDVSFQNRGCNELSGWFRVTEAGFGVGGTIESFGATFAQHCEGGTPSLFGSFGYVAESTSPPVPEPSTWSLFGIGMLAIARVARKRGASALH